MSTRNIVAIGASTGGFEALQHIVNQLPAGFGASVLVTQHLPSEPRSRLDEILSSAGALPSRFAKDGEPLETGRIYLAPPERHLLLDGYRVALGTGPRENSARPAIDPMLRSVGLCCGFRAIGVILTGALDDGAAGLADMKRQGAIAVVQSPADAACPEMPAAAANRCQPDYVIGLREIPPLLAALVETPAGEPRPASDRLQMEVEIARGRRRTIADNSERQAPIPCPDCGGVLRESEEMGKRRYRCQLCDAFTADVLEFVLDDGTRHALDTALRALQERIRLIQRLQKRAEDSGQEFSASSWAQRLAELERDAGIMAGAIERADALALDQRKD